MDNTAEGWFEIQPEDIEPAILPIIQREISQFAVELEAIFFQILESGRAAATTCGCDCNCGSSTKE